MTDISIVITNYNKGHLLERAVRSAAGQFLLRKTIEIIVVDDASTDDSLKRISDLGDEVIIIKHKSNLGVSQASNSGLSASSGKYWMRLDADDYLSQMAIQHMSAILDSNDQLDFVYGDLLKINLDGSQIERVKLNKIDQLLLHGAGVLFKKDTLVKFGGYNNDLRNGEDFDLIARMLKGNASSFYLPIPLYRYFSQKDSLTSQDNREQIISNLRSKYGF
jgi:glycosyltransferase involved in cell wall biosynthesis